MYTESFESDAKVWVTVLKNSLHSGNRIGCARLHMVQQMINKRLEWLRSWSGGTEEKHKLVMETCSRLCEFAKQREVTSAEKNIYMHTMIDLLEAELKDLPAEPPRRLVETDDGKDFDEAYPPEDSPEYLIPPGNTAVSPPFDAGNWIG